MLRHTAHQTPTPPPSLIRDAVALLPSPAAAAAAVYFTENGRDNMQVTTSHNSTYSTFLKPSFCCNIVSTGSLGPLPHAPRGTEPAGSFRCGRSCCAPQLWLPVLLRSAIQRLISHVTRYTSHVTRHMSHVTRHTSHITHHTSHVTCTSLRADVRVPVPAQSKQAVLQLGRRPNLQDSVTCHMSHAASHVTCHMSHVTCMISHHCFG